MAQKAVTIYTPATEDAHITAEDDAQIFRAIFGNVSGIGEADNQLLTTKVDDNTVRIQSGLFSNQGYIVKVDAGTTADVTVTSGTSGYYRRDLLVAEFTRGGGETADVHIFKVIAGTPNASESAAADPSLTQDSLIGGGGSVRQEAVHRIYIAGTTLGTIERVAPYIGSYYE